MSLPITKTWYVYQIGEGSFCDWYYWGVGEGSKNPTRRELGQFARAVIILSRLTPEKDWFDSSHEYWTTYFPGAGVVVIVRPESNPFSAGYVISGIELPWMKILEGTVEL